MGLAVSRMASDEAVLCKWSEQEAAGHNAIVSRSRATIDNARAAQAEAPRDPYYHTRIAVSVTNKHAIDDLSKKYHTGTDHESSCLHPHYSLGRPHTVLDASLNQPHRWDFSHRNTPSTFKHGYAHIRDTRDLSNREGP